jgi:hypothetical protein
MFTGYVIEWSENINASQVVVDGVRFSLLFVLSVYLFAFRKSKNVGGSCFKIEYCFTSFYGNFTHVFRQTLWQLQGT